MSDFNYSQAQSVLSQAQSIGSVRPVNTIANGVYSLDHNAVESLNSKVSNTLLSIDNLHEKLYNWAQSMHNQSDSSGKNIGGDMGSMMSTALQALPAISGALGSVGSSLGSVLGQGLSAAAGLGSLGANAGGGMTGGGIATDSAQSPDTTSVDEHEVADSDATHVSGTSDDSTATTDNTASSGTGSIGATGATKGKGSFIGASNNNEETQLTTDQNNKTAQQSGIRMANGYNMSGVNSMGQKGQDIKIQRFDHTGLQDPNTTSSDKKYQDAFLFGNGDDTGSEMIN